MRYGQNAILSTPYRSAETLPSLNLVSTHLVASLARDSQASTSKANDEFYVEENATQGSFAGLDLLLQASEVRESTTLPRRCAMPTHCEPKVTYATRFQKHACSPNAPSLFSERDSFATRHDVRFKNSIKKKTSSANLTHTLNLLPPFPAPFPAPFQPSPCCPQ
eukprot:124935-Prorocentrum_minimum.AAC.1